MTDVTKRALGGRIAFVAGLVAAGLVVMWLVYGGSDSVSTENAYVKAEKFSLSADIAGRISEVAVAANQPVERDQVLVRLDDVPYQLSVAEAKAHLHQVKNHILARRADYAEAEARLRKGEEDVAYYQRKLKRNENAGPAAISESQLDDLRQQLSLAQADIGIHRQSLAKLRAELGGNPDLPIEQQADYMAAQAQLDDALYKLSRTVIRAPASGIVANEIPQVSEMAVAGMSLISMIGTEKVWVEANLKETQVARVETGQSAVVVVDAWPDREWLAEVDSVSPASGSEFALIPAQNASGNWVKVVQRIPVRLRLLLNGDEPPLRSGMSASVHIDLSSGGDVKPDSSAEQ